MKIFKWFWGGSEKNHWFQLDISIGMLWSFPGEKEIEKVGELLQSDLVFSESDSSSGDVRACVYGPTMKHNRPFSDNVTISTRHVLVLLKAVDTIGNYSK